MTKGERIIGREQDYQTDDIWSSNTKVLYSFKHAKRKGSEKALWRWDCCPDLGIVLAFDGWRSCYLYLRDHFDFFF